MADWRRLRSRDEAMRFLEALFFEPNSMRFFRQLIVQAGRAGRPAQGALADHVATLNAEIASFFNRPSDDPAVVMFIDRLRGLAIRLLVEPKGRDRPKIHLKKIAEECGLL